MDAREQRPPILLASTSPQRKDLLQRLGVPFSTGSPAYDEQDIPGITPKELSMRHARGKAASFAASHPDHLIIGSDQVVVCNDRILGKPGTPERAVEQLALMGGRTSRLITAVHITHPVSGRSEEFWDEHRLSVRQLPRERLARYVAADNPLWCAGSFKLEQRGIALFERIEGGDYTGIIGLPLMGTAAALERFGWEVP